MDKLNAMHSFVRVVEAGSFSAAARQLRIGQPAVSKIIAQLEDRLGVRLLTRTTRGLSPTEAGQIFYERSKRVIEDVGEAELAARGSGKGLTGKLRISAPVTFARLHIVPRLPEFLAEHPDISIDVILDDRNVDVVEEGLDLALKVGDVVDSSLVARKIGQSQRRVIATPEYFERCGEPLAPDDLRNHEAVIYAQGSGGTVWCLRQGATEILVTLTGRLHVSAAEGVRSAVLAGVGLSISSEWMFQPELENGMVKAVLSGWALPPMDLWAIFPTGRLVSAKARAFTSFVENALIK